MDSAQLDSQRTITFTTAQEKRRPYKINKTAKIFSMCVLKKSIIEPAKTALLDTKIELPERPVGTLVVCQQLRHMN